MGRAAKRLSGFLAWWLGRPDGSLRYRVYCLAYGAASAIHLALPGTLSTDRFWYDVVHLLGVVGVARNGSMLAWLLCGIGLVGPILFAEDQLTQGIYLLACTLAALGTGIIGGTRRQRALGVTLPSLVRVFTVGVYGLAALHKLNSGFLDPSVSCATGGMQILSENWGIPGIAVGPIGPLLPHLFIAVEITVATLFIVRPAAAMVLAVAMHIPLTIVFAPSFAFTMISGWVCFLTDEEIRHLGHVLSNRRWVIGLAGGGLGLLSFTLYMQDHWVVYTFWSLKEAALWMMGVWLILAWKGRKPPVFGWWSAWAEARRPRDLRFIALAASLWLVHGLTPYLGLQMHRTGAMLSNLRVDEGCWNSLLFPESMRVRDPYVRIRRAQVGPVEGREALVTLIEERLWSPRTLWNAKDDWCKAGAAPVEVSGSYAGAEFEFGDLCAEGPWPESGPALGRLRLFQRNLDRQCPQTCIH